MSLVLTPHGEATCLRRMLEGGLPTSQNFRIGLYTNNVTPTRNTIWSNLTEMSTSGTGYAQKELLYSQWNGTVVQGNPSSWTYASVQEFSLSGSLNAYGWFMLDADGLLMGAERFPAAPFVINGTNQKIRLTMSLRLKDEQDESAGLFEVVNSGEDKLIGLLAQYYTPHFAGMEFQFYTNDYTPTDASVLSDFTICADTAFAVTYDMNGATGFGNVTTEADRTIVTLPEVFAVSTSFVGTLYGWRLRTTVALELIAAERFSEPMVVSAIGQSVRFNPVFSVRTGTF